MVKVSSNGIPQDCFNPRWDETEKVHDWKNYVHFELRNLWHTFNEKQKQLIANNAQIIADDEEWN